MTEIVKEMMDVKTFLAIYSISRGTYFNEVKRGNLKITRIGGRTYIQRVHAQEWLSKSSEN